MMGESGTTNRFSVLRRFVEGANASVEAVEEQCELCGTLISPSHRHMLEIATREVMCVCYPCSILFDSPAASEGRYRLIPERRLALAGFQMSDVQWESLRIPVGLAFIFYSTPAGKMVAYYPSPMGATESLLHLDTWKGLVETNPVLEEMEPDVEALLINRSQGEESYFLVPIDDSYRLVALLRTTWKGLSGGEEVWQAISAFFDSLRKEAT